MHKVRKLISIVILILCINVIYLNNLRNESFQLQKILLSDLSKGEYNLDLNDLDRIYTAYPNLAINTIPLKTIKSRYLNFYNLKNEADVLLDISITENPYSVYAYYLKSRILIEQNKNIQALDYLKMAFKLSPRTNYSSSVYFTLLGNLGMYQELINIYPTIKSIPDWSLWQFYLLALNNSKPQNNLNEFNEIISFARTIFNEKEINFNN